MASSSELGPRYHFHGVIGGDDKLRLLGEARASQSDCVEEPFGMAPVEAMLCGTPVLTTLQARCQIVDADTGGFFDTDKNSKWCWRPLPGFRPALPRLRRRPFSHRPHCEKLPRALRPHPGRRALP
jgi:glycosyltransferase involved in cell wall biosynthesis